MSERDELVAAFWYNWAENFNHQRFWDYYVVAAGDEPRLCAQCGRSVLDPPDNKEVVDVIPTK